MHSFSSPSSSSSSSSFLVLLFFFLVILVNKPQDSPNLQHSLNRCDCTKKTRCNPRLIPQKTRHDISTEGGAKLTRSNSTTQIASQKKIKQKHVWEGASLKLVRSRNQHLSICRTGKTMENYGVEQTGPS